MKVTCDQCDNSYAVPVHLLGKMGRQLRCGECGAGWWQPVEGASSVPAPQRSPGRMLTLWAGGQYREEGHRFTSFFDGVSNRFGTLNDDASTLSSQRFQRLNHSRRQHHRREANAIVEAEFKEIRDFGHMRDWCRVWLPRGAVVALFVATALTLVFAP